MIERFLALAIVVIALPSVAIAADEAKQPPAAAAVKAGSTGPSNSDSDSHTKSVGCREPGICGYCDCPEAPPSNTATDPEPPATPKDNNTNRK